MNIADIPPSETWVRTIANCGEPSARAFFGWTVSCMHVNANEQNAVLSSAMNFVSEMIEKNLTTLGISKGHAVA
jgi:hypothetical protein